ncbi:hypothetical protein AX16_002574 [Volvariella volvacea WC 439]|nr:hypothetical protein AX16_002574 [Volvariella volvacea WC 439]
MDGPGYVNILQESYLGILKDFGMKCSGKTAPIFQQDNDPKHTSGVAKAWFEKKKVCRLPWAPSSPDMNIIEHVWQQLDARICACNPLPHNKEEFWEALQEEWYLFSQEALDKLYESMPRHVASLLAARGGHTKY